MPTARQLIDRAMTELGVLAAESALTAAEAADGLVVLNELLETWTLERLMVYATVRNTVALVVNQRTYTVGTGGNWNITRPVAIERALWHETSSGLDLPIDLLTEEQYADIVLKDTPSTFPVWLWYNATFPLGTAEVWPVPTVVNQVILYSRTPFTAFTNLSTDIDFPPGYTAAIRYNLALALAPQYNAPVSDLLADLARTTKLKIKRVNSKPPLLGVDEALLRTTRIFNYRTGE